MKKETRYLKQIAHDIHFIYNVIKIYAYVILAILGVALLAVVLEA